MLKKLLLLFLTVSQILASSFVEDGKRAELFEIMDTEVPTFRVTIPSEKFVELKQALQAPKLEDVLQIVGVIEFEKVKDATLVVEINGTEKEFKKVTFDIGGNSARTYGRQGFNLKIRDKNKDLYGRTQFRLRSDPRDATFLRSKLACDMLNRLDIPSISANYAKLYVNEEYFGFYVFMDAPKIPWIEQVFGEKDTKNLYKCKTGGSYLTNVNAIGTCENEDDKLTDMTDFNNFITALDNAQTVDEIRDFFDVDQFLYLAAFDYLVGAWDHFFMGGHNYSMYKNKDGKWIMIYYDFDSDIGQDIVSIEFFNLNPNPDKNYPHHTVQDWFHFQNHLNDIAIWNNLPEFEAKLAEVVEKVFNPGLLFPHIDELKDYIRPYILHDKTPDPETGINPGVLNILNPTDYSMEQWEANSEFTTINEPAVGSDAYGIKYWILERYRAVCEYYSLECDPVFMDENYKYPIVKEVEGEINIHKWDGYDWLAMMGFVETDESETPTEEPTGVDEPTDEPTEANEEEPTGVDEPTDEPTEANEEEPTENPTEVDEEEPTENPTEVDEPAEKPTEVEEPTEKPTEVDEENEEPTEQPTELDEVDEADNEPIEVADELADETNESSDESSSSDEEN